MPEASEDCLYLNVTAPAATDLPVLVWLHSGGYQVGNGTLGAGDGAAFTRKHGVVVVTFNYRLGALGFLTVDGEAHGGAFGLHDQIAPLRWVRKILAAQNAIGEGMRATWLWRPAIDGRALTARPIDAISAGAAAGIPLLAWTCVNECFIYQLMAPDAAEQADRVLREYFGEVGRDEILGAYAAARPDLADDPTRLGVEVMTDERYVIPTTRLADAQSAHAPVWRSRYDVPLTGLPPVIAPGGVLPAIHGTDGGPIWNGGEGTAGLMH